jgi:hypothetical protein
MGCKMLGWNRGGGIVFSLVQNVHTGPGVHPTIQYVMRVSQMWMGGYDRMDIYIYMYSSLGERNTAIVLLVRSVGNQKRRRTENI